MPKRKSSKTSNTPVSLAKNSISFVNENTNKAIVHTATYNGGDFVDFSMTLTDNDGNNITAKIPITTIKQIINTNYNIRIIGFSSGIYMFEFDRAAFEQFLKDNGL